MPEFDIPGRPEFRVYYNSEEDGGGTWFGQEYIDVIRDRYDRNFNRCMEWCSGPGFIGFGLLAHGICDELCLLDGYVHLSASIRQTTQHNLCEDRVTYYCLDRIADLPHDEVFDLIVANPPHYLECPGDINYQRIAVDRHWQAHREFYSNISRHMHDESVILLQENQAGSIEGPLEFRDMIDQSKLKITGYFTSPHFYDTDGPTQIYYIEVRKR